MDVHAELKALMGKRVRLVTYDSKVIYGRLRWLEETRQYQVSTRLFEPSEVQQVVSGDLASLPEIRL